MSTKNLGFKLRRLRLERDLPLRRVAAMLDMDVAILSKMERGERKFTKNHVLKLAELYNCNPEDLLIQFFSDKILYEIGDEPYALQALQAAEESVLYRHKNHISTAPAEIFSKQKIMQDFEIYFSSQSLVSKAFLFGSYARGDDNAQSDIDIVIDVPKETPFTFFDLDEIRENLELISHRKVDVVMLNGLRPAMKDRIEKEMVKIYEK